MDNDILINQARQLYATLQVRQASAAMVERLERLSICAYRRYQRRLNRCAVCYLTRSYECIREPGEKIILCARHQDAEAIDLCS